MSQETYQNPKQPLEIERKFLVSAMPDNIESYKNTMIRQGYVAVSEDGTEVRVRSTSTDYYLTVKTSLKDDISGMVRPEMENRISKELFTSLWDITDGKRIEKVRFYVPFDGNTIELDVYLGELQGLMTAEVEFSDEQSAIQFTPPAWLGEDVTKNKAYKNQSLARFGKP